MAATRWSGQAPDILAHGGCVNLIENTFSRHEDKIVAKIVDIMKEYPKVKRAFFTGHSLGGGVANVAHLVVRGQLKKAVSPWAKLYGKVDWLCLSFAAPQTIVRLYEPEAAPILIRDLDNSSFNIVYGCDIVPRPGMLAYVGNLLEIVVPNILEEGYSLILNKYPFLRALLSLRKLASLLDNDSEAVIKFLKDKGYAFTLDSLTPPRHGRVPEV